jgi:hypothetical protein
MKTNPIHAPRDYYRGHDPRKRAKTDRFNQVAARVEAFLNGEIAKLPDDTIHVFLSYEIASVLREDSDLVHRIVFGIDGGSNGVTIWKGDYDRAWQKRTNPPISGAT